MWRMGASRARTYVRYTCGARGGHGALVEAVSSVSELTTPPCDVLAEVAPSHPQPAASSVLMSRTLTTLLLSVMSKAVVLRTRACGTPAKNSKLGMGKNSRTEASSTSETEYTV
jgi:hypothetical protein